MCREQETSLREECRETRERWSEEIYTMASGSLSTSKTVRSSYPELEPPSSIIKQFCAQRPEVEQLEQRLTGRVRHTPLGLHLGRSVCSAPRSTQCASPYVQCQRGHGEQHLGPQEKQLRAHAGEGVADMNALYVSQACVADMTCIVRSRSSNRHCPARSGVSKRQKIIRKKDVLEDKVPRDPNLLPEAQVAQPPVA
jgi:hypothetical protein